MERKETEILVRWGALIIGLIFTIIGLFIEKYSLHLFITGILVLSTDLLAWLILTTPARITMIDYTPTAEDNWHHAKRMLRHLSPNQGAFDVSSIENEAEFDQIFVRKCREEIHFSRIIACDPKENGKTRQWMMKMLDPDEDPAQQYEAVREAIKRGNLQIMHFPHRIYTDFFIVDDPHTRKGEVVLGFQKSVTFPTYNTGIYTKSYEITTDFRLFFNSIQERARQHLQGVKRNDIQCDICSKFDCTEYFTTLLPKEKVKKGTVPNEKTEKVLAQEKAEKRSP